MLIETVNLHVWPKCNLNCVYCYQTFPERRPSLPLTSWCEILELLQRHGVRRVTFSGGEPTLHPDLGGMLARARAIGLQTSIVTNGARISDDMLEMLDIVGITLDAVNDDVLTALGRQSDAASAYLQHVRDLARRVHRAGALLKINSVVTRLNVDEYLGDVLAELRPFKWKPMQFTHVPGENDGVAADLEVDEAAFDAFVRRHHVVKDAGVWVEPESSTVIHSTYVMVDPLGRVMQDAPAGRRFSRSVLEVGLAGAMAEVGGYDRRRFVARGGHHDVRALQRGGRGSR